MEKGIKIVAGVMAVLGIVAGIFLLTAKKKTAQIPTTQKQSVPATTKTQTNVNNSAITNHASTSQQQNAIQDAKAKTANQWQQCKNGNFDPTAVLYWSVQITEAIPDGGTYAKGYLNSDQTKLVHVIIKPDAADASNIKSRLVTGKMAFVRATCTQVASDGAVTVQAY